MFPEVPRGHKHLKSVLDVEIQSPIPQILGLFVHTPELQSPANSRIDGT